MTDQACRTTESAAYSSQIGTTRKSPFDYKRPMMRVIKPFSKSCFAVTFLAISLITTCAASQETRPRYSQQPDQTQNQVLTVPTGTVISVRMESSLNSRTSRVGDKFTATVTTPIYVDGRTVIPAGAIVEGRVTDVTAAKRPSRSGTIAVEFDDLVFPNGTGMRLVGSLTASDPRDRARIDDESRVSGEKGKKATVFIGGGAVVGAVLGGMAGGGIGAVAGGAIGAGAGIAAVLLSKGVEAEVLNGSEFGVQLSQPLTIAPENLPEGAPASAPPDPAPPTSHDAGDVSNAPAAAPADSDAPVDLSSSEMMKRAQGALKEQGYYEGSVDGAPSQRTTTALRAYQRDHKLQETGELDEPTARSLGILSSGAPSSAREEKNRDRGARSDEPVPANVLGATATRTSRNSVHVVIHTQANSGGWRWDEEHRVVGDKLEILAVAIRPTGYATQALTRGTIEVDLREGGERLTSVTIHSAGEDLSIPLASLSYRSKSAPLQPRIEDLLADYERRLGVRGGPSRTELSSARYSDSEIELLFALSNLANSARLYVSMNASLESVSKLRIATLAVARDARRVDRIITGGGSQSFQPIAPKWDSIRQDVLSLMRKMDIRPSEIEWQ